MIQPPFKYGDRVRIKDNDHLNDHIVLSCEWYEDTKPGVDPYWYCSCQEIRDPIDWSKIPPNSTGIIGWSGWNGSSKHLELVDDPS